jgi:hypothetical protein
MPGDPRQNTPQEKTERKKEITAFFIVLTQKNISCFPTEFYQARKG